MEHKLPQHFIENLDTFLNHENGMANQIGAITLNSLGVIPKELLKCMIDIDKFNLVKLEVKEDGSYKTRVDLGCICYGGNPEEVMSTIHEVKNLVSFDYCCKKLSFTTKLKALVNLQKWKGSINYIPENREMLFFEIFSEMKKLRWLELYKHGLKYIPESIGNFKFLEILVVDNNYLNDLPPSFASLQNLRILDLGNNEIKELPECIESLEKLTVLKLSRNKLIELPSFLKNMTNLEYLDISYNPIRKIPSVILEMKSLKGLLIRDFDTFDEGEIDRVKEVLGEDILETEGFFPENKLLKDPLFD